VVKVPYWAASGMGGVGDGRCLLLGIRDHPYMHRQSCDFLADSGEDRLRIHFLCFSSVWGLQRSPCYRLWESP
jgi:hypothetical protein